MASERLAVSLIVISLWLPVPAAFAGQGCCSTHGGAAGCVGAKMRCNDGTISPTCKCQDETILSAPQAQDQLALMQAAPPEVKPYVTPITRPIPADSIDGIPRASSEKPYVTPANRPETENTIDSLPPQQPPKPYTQEVTGSQKGSGDNFKKPKAGLSGKEGSTDVPSWAKGKRPHESESGKKFAKRLLDAKYGPGNYPKGPGSEFNKIQKWGDRAFE